IDAPILGPARPANSRLEHGRAHSPTAGPPRCCANMADMQRLPAGTWPSPLTAPSLVGGSTAITGLVADGDDVWWSESRPDEGGRTAIVRWHGGAATETTPPGANVRTRVHEYGGGAWWVAGRTLYYCE